MFTSITIILLSMVVICELITLRVFFYQRTVRILGIRFGIPISFRNIFYPHSMLTMFRLSHLKWIVILVLFFIEWKCALIAIGITVAFFVTSIFLPYSDYANLLKIRDVIYSQKQELPVNVYDEIMKEINRGFEKTGGPIPPPVGVSPLPRVTSFVTWIFACGITLLLIIVGSAASRLIINHNLTFLCTRSDIVLSLIGGTCLWFMNKRQR